MKKNKLIKFIFLIALGFGILSCSLVTEGVFNSEDVYFPMPSEDGYGLMNCDGEWVLDPLEKGVVPLMMVDDVAPFMNFMSDSDYQVGIMNKDGDYLVEDAFSRAFPFSEGLALIHIDDTIRFVDQSGAFAFDDEFALANGPISRFGDGLANVPYEVRDMGTGFSAIDSMIYIDKTGEKVLGPYMFANPFSDGYAGVTMKEDGEYLSGFIDTDGEFVLQFSQDEDLRPAGEYAEGLFPVLDMEKQLKEGECAIGFMNKDKEWVIDPQFCKVGRFSDGLAAVAGESDTGIFEFGFIDTSGNMEIKPQYMMSFPPEFQGGCAVVNWDSFRGFGLIDTDGNLIYEFER